MTEKKERGSSDKCGRNTGVKTLYATIEGRFFVRVPSYWLFVYVTFVVGEKVNELDSTVVQLCEKPGKKFDLLCSRLVKNTSTSIFFATEKYFAEAICGAANTGRSGRSGG